MTEPQAKPKTWADHQPDSPFGCEIQWGKKWAETGQFADYRTHICNHSGYRDHDEHVCKCGEQYDGPLLSDSDSEDPRTTPSDGGDLCSECHHQRRSHWPDGCNYAECDCTQFDGA